ncbi:NtaA/DmoA family FMN-dependent monooxygenase [Microbacterium atlanticum]|uniref:NtaA/DmoA family FMN-dependent monooxygenase n=1 Tax=Microbacterium atlanticum TaxID=2782168 RepID=UPI001E3E8328|nr:NtaA/DmoA family FMN-dependent monooxygenase [Microbacterium atlanticum]
MPNNRYMRFVAMLMTGPTQHHTAAWRHPESVNAHLDPQWWQEIARTLERGHFDGLFLADTLTFGNTGIADKGGQIALLDPLPLIALMAQATSRIGLGVTVSTTFIPPYAIARALSTLDIISGGRLAWNVVTSWNEGEAKAMGQDTLPPREARYQRAHEILELCMKFWSSWNGAQVIADKASGRFIETSAIDPIAFEGEFVAASGYFSTPPAPQGHPVIMQAGSSPAGRDFAARWAELVFTLQNDLEDMQAFYTDMKTRTADYGREPGELAILTSIDPIIGETSEIAREKQEYINSLVEWDVAVATIKNHLGIDIRELPLDKPVSSLTDDALSIGALEVLIKGAQRENLTLREAAFRYATSDLTPQVVGTPEEVADQLEAYFTADGCDGFIVTPTQMPGTFEAFTRSVMPILQKRGFIDPGLDGRTFRRHLRATPAAN